MSYFKIYSSEDGAMIHEYKTKEDLLITKTGQVVLKGVNK